MTNKAQPQRTQSAEEFYKANATNIVNVPRPGHPEDKSGWDGVRRASETQFIAKDVLVMPLWDVYAFAEAYAHSLKQAAVPTEPFADPSKEELVIEIARELYDRFVMGGWEPQDAYPQIRKWLRFSSSLDLSDAKNNH